MDKLRHKITLPWRIPYGKKKVQYFYVNLNQYRNTHFHILNSVKRTFEDMVSKSVLALPAIEQAELTYLIYPHQNKKLDVSNVCSIADKFFSDLLTLHSKIPDDNFGHIQKVTYAYGGKSDRGYSYIEVFIDIIKLQEEDTVRMLFTKTDVLSVLAAHVAGIVREGTEFELEIKGTGDEMEVHVITSASADSDVAEDKPKPAPTKRAARKPAVTKPVVGEKPEPEPEEQDESPVNEPGESSEDDEDENLPFDPDQAGGEDENLPFDPDSANNEDGENKGEAAGQHPEEPAKPVKKGGLFDHLKAK